MNLMQRRSRMPEQDQINFSFWSTAPAPAEAGSGDEAQPFILSGDFELRSEGSLLAPITAWVVTLDATGSGVAFEVGKEVVELYPRTLRYTPNEGHARARIPVSFRYIAEPFELRYADASTPP
jgi:predicted nuclease with RNAse H fold